MLAHGDELVAVANHREETARAFAERHGIPRVTTDWEALAADPEVDAAVVATPNALHAPQTVALLRAGNARAGGEADGDARWRHATR